MGNKNNILIAAAWPYANGSLHLGHVAALLGSDILARYYRHTAHDVLFVSGSDCHGTPIAVEADRLGVPPAEIAAKYHKEFIETLINGLGFSYDLYTTTTTKNHRQVVQDIFLKLQKSGHIYTKTEDLPYCPRCKRFLPDRYVEGECPHCHYKDARGDQCDNCGKLLDPRELIDPRCKICSTTPEWRPSEHFFLKLSAFENQLRGFVKKSAGWRANAKQFALNLIEQGLPDRAITRDTDWGIPIPVPGYEGKRLYVWFEAVCGYLSASKEWAQQVRDPNAWEKFWTGKKALHYYVHGKDNIPFHTLIWPAILLGYGGLHLPDRIISSEYLTLEHQQLSKSRHWVVSLPEYLEKFDPDALRYYLVAAGPENADADFSWSDYRTRINTELIATFGNFVNRALSFARQHFSDGLPAVTDPDKEASAFLNIAKDTFKIAGRAIEEGKFREALRSVIALCEHGNRFFNSAAPWESIKSEKNQTVRDLAAIIHVIRCLAILVSPFLPRTAEKIRTALDLAAEPWQYPEPSPITVREAKLLFRKIEEAEMKDQFAKLGVPAAS